MLPLDAFGERSERKAAERKRERENERGKERIEETKENQEKMGCEERERESTKPAAYHATKRGGHFVVRTTESMAFLRCDAMHKMPRSSASPTCTASFPFFSFFVSLFHHRIDSKTLSCIFRTVYSVWWPSLNLRIY